MNPAVAAAKLAVKQTCPFLAQSKTSLGSNQLPALVQTFSGICPFLKSVAADPNLPAAVSQKLAAANNGTYQDNRRFDCCVLARLNHVVIVGI